MSYFVAIAAYRCEIDGVPVASVEFKVVFLDAATADDAEALLRAEPVHSYLNGDGQLVSWPLVGIPNIQGHLPMTPGREIIGFIADSDDFAHWAGHAA